MKYAVISLFVVSIGLAIEASLTGDNQTMQTANFLANLSLKGASPDSGLGDFLKCFINDLFN